MTDNTACMNANGQASRNPRHATRKVDAIDADIIVRSSDRVDFFVHRIILSMGSTFCGTSQLQGAAPALVQVAEDSGALDTFLRILYPLVDPEVDSLSHLQSVLAAGVKYDAPSVVASMRNALVGPRFLESDPVRVFAIACRCQLEEEARIAARRAVVLDRVSGLHPEQCSELNDVSAGAFFRLLQLHRTRVTFPRLNKWVSLTADDTNVSFFGIEPFCTGRPAFPPAQSTATSTPSSSASSEASFVSCSSEPQSPISGEEERRREAGSSESNSRRINVPVDASRLEKLDAKQFADVLFSILRSGQRVAMGQSTLASAWMMLTEKRPLLGYFIAVENGWKEEALASARQLVGMHNARDLAMLYEPKMETISSLPYRRLLAYAQACREAASADFELRGLPARRCPSWCGCHARYPLMLSIASPLEWLRAHFKAARDALRDRPCRTQVQSDCVESPFVVSLKAIVIPDQPPCTQGKNKVQSGTSLFAGKIPIM